MTGAPPLPAGWVQALQDRLQQPPQRARVPLTWRGTPIGSLEPALVTTLHQRVPAAAALLQLQGEQACVAGEALTPALARLADALREAGLAHAWRDEQLAVAGPDGQVLGTVERAVVRPLGVPTRAVHLVGLAPDGRHWVQQRALDKANDPGLWDTLMGGMVPACDTLQEALARETWEEAGLQLAQLRGLRAAGRVERRGPSGDSRSGYVIESIDWFRCEVPTGVVPANQDGEVARFELLEAAQLRERLLAGAFTLEAAAIFAQLWQHSA